ncbi:MAG: alpha/beta hydrolase [Alphaproteobacteria bacterium]|nr:alpha/beta hydrolase [Rhodospirillaceae bacterium]MDG2480683.1 alpha/beta hydrolase [Alphaproteobacteria bacterium]
MVLDYPPQEPFSEVGRKYHEEVSRLGSGVVAATKVSFGADPYQSLAVFPAAEPSGDVLLFWHGGGWTNGYKEWLFFMAPALNDAGITFVSAGYRLAPQHLFPAGPEDARDALAWVHGNIADYGGNPDRIFIGGHSAGGHYASLIALGNSASSVRGVLPISGVFLFGKGSGLSQNPRFLGKTGNEHAASPLAAISGKPPPFLLAHGGKDFSHLIEQAHAMESALLAAGSDASRIVLGDCNHFEASYVSGQTKGPWLENAVTWMHNH